VRIGENTEIKCLWVETLERMLMLEWPDFIPEEGRMERILEEHESRECIMPVDLVCSKQTGMCKIQDGRHRIVAARMLNREKILAVLEYRYVSW
jgi:hypothetical protein